MMERAKAKIDDSNEEYNLIPFNKHFFRTDEVIPLGEQTFDIEQELSKHR